MRNRDEVMDANRDAYEDFGNAIELGGQLSLILEVLLDIRDLLTPKP